MLMLDEFYQVHSADISAIYKTGSCTVPFLSDISRDADYVLVTPDKASFLRVRKAAESKGLHLLGSVFTVLDDGKYVLRPYVWQNHYIQKLYGNANVKRYDEEFLNHILEYKVYVQERYANMGSHMFDDKKHSYQYLMGAYIVMHMNYEFGAVEQQAVRSAHQYGLSESDIRLIKQVFELHDPVEQGL